MEVFFKTEKSDYIYLTTIKVSNARTRIKIHNFETTKTKYVYSTAHLPSIAKNFNKIENEIAKMFNTTSNVQILIEKLETIY